MSVEAKFVTITPKQAEQLLRLNTHNRPVQLTQVDRYAADMAKGDWQLNGEAIKVSVAGQILDGQHRLTAILQANTPIETLLITGLPAETQETMDQGRARTFGDLLKLRGEPDYYNLAATVRMVCCYERDAVPFIGRGQPTPTNHQLTRTLERNPEIRASVRFAAALRRSWVNLSMVAAMHYLFAIVDPGEAEYFIHSLATGENIDAGSPIYVLRERLIKERFDARGIHVKVKLAFIVRAWNAWRQGDTITRLVWSPGGLSPDRFPPIDGLANRQIDAEAAAA